MYDREVAMSAYVQLAVLSHEKRQGLVRDRFLLLAAVEACRAGWPEVSERCRAMLVAANPAHQVSRHATVADALRDADFQRLVVKWERYCPFEQAEHLLQQLGIDPAHSESDLPWGARMLELLEKRCNVSRSSVRNSRAGTRDDPPRGG